MKHTWKENTLPPELKSNYVHIKHVKKITFCIVTDKAFLMRMCRPYRYLIQINGTQSNAFETKEAFGNWIKERKLKIKKINGRMYQLVGKYLDCCHCADYEVIKEALGSPSGYILSNGDFTDAWINHNNPIPEIHYINPNYKRKVWDYFQAAKFLF